MATQPQIAEQPEQDPLLRCAERINASLSGVFSRIDRLSQATLQIWRGLPSAPSARDMVAGVRPLIDKTLRDADGLLQGGGIILEPGTLQDKEMYAEWRCLNQAGRITQLALSFNRKSESYYDYRNMPWFTRPQQSGRSSITGPYIDLYGQDMNILTFTSPLHLDGRFIGIAGIDIISSRFEAILIAHLVRLPHEALIISEEDRVIAANSAGFVAGELFGQGGFHGGQSRRIEIGEGRARWGLIEYAKTGQTN